MADVSPFHGFRFCVEQLSNAELARFVARPYEGIERDAIAHDPPPSTEPRSYEGIATPRHYPSIHRQHNLYTHTHHKILDWLAARHLKVEDVPMCYIYDQTFEGPHGHTLTRRGLIGRVRLADYAAQIVLPHERTLSAPKLDRLELMKATEVNLNQVFMLYQDVEHVIERKLAAIRERSGPMLELTTYDGIHHQLWGFSDESLVADIKAFFEGQQLLIADGHHRYETALEYRDWRRELAAGDIEEDAPYEHVMTLLVNAHDPGLLVLPTHRVVHGVQDFDMARVIAMLERADYFKVTMLDRELLLDVPALLRSCAEAGEAHPCFVFISPDHEHPVLVEYLGDVSAPIFDAETPEVVRALDVTVLHEAILDRLLGIDKQAQAAKTNLRYRKRLESAMAELSMPDTQLVVLMNATPVAQIHTVCQSGGLMPQKSTYFYPKILNSLMISPLS